MTHRSNVLNVRWSPPNRQRTASQSSCTRRCRQRCPFWRRRQDLWCWASCRSRTQLEDRACPSRIFSRHDSLAGERIWWRCLWWFRLRCGRNAEGRWRMAVHRRKCICKELRNYISKNVITCNNSIYRGFPFDCFRQFSKTFSSFQYFRMCSSSPGKLIDSGMRCKSAFSSLNAMTKKLNVDFLAKRLNRSKA